MSDTIREIVPPNGYKESKPRGFPVLTSQFEDSSIPISLTNRPLSEIDRYFENILSKSIELKLKKAGSKKVGILDLGSGTQSLACKEIDEKYGEAIRTIGIDFYPKYSKEINVVQGDVRQLPFEANSFDIIFSVQVLNYIDHKEDESIISEINRVLKPQGVAFLHWDSFVLLDLDQTQTAPLLEYAKSLGLVWKSKIIRYVNSHSQLFHAVIKPPVDKKILENINQVDNFSV